MLPCYCKPPIVYFYFKGPDYDTEEFPNFSGAPLQPFEVEQTSTSDNVTTTSVGSSVTTSISSQLEQTSTSDNVTTTSVWSSVTTSISSQLGQTST